jgi:hypothetical protein
MARIRRTYPIDRGKGSHINTFEFINDNRAAVRRARWDERRVIAVNKSLVRARSRSCPRCGGNAGRVCPCRYRSRLR